MEFISLLVLLPMFLSSAPEATVPTAQAFPNAPKIEMSQEGMLIAPPADRSLAMTVLEYQRPIGGRAPAAVAVDERRVDVVVEAP